MMCWYSLSMLLATVLLFITFCATQAICTPAK